MTFLLSVPWRMFPLSMGDGIAAVPSAAMTPILQGEGLVQQVTFSISRFSEFYNSEMLESAITDRVTDLKFLHLFRGH